MANEFDFFPLFYRQLLIDTADMTNRQFGAYFRLLLRAWDETPVGTVPDNDSILAPMAREDSVGWTELKPIVMSRFQPPSNGRYGQKKMRQVYADLRRRRKEKSDAGRTAAKALWQQKKEANALPPHSGCNAKETETQTKSKKPPPSGALPPVPENLKTPEFLSAWADWLAFRAERKPKVTPLAAKQQLADMSEWGPARAIIAIRHSIRGSYQGLFEPGRPPVKATATPEHKARVDKEQAERQAHLAAERSHEAEVHKLLAAIDARQMTLLVRDWRAEQPQLRTRDIDPATHKHFRQWVWEQREKVVA